MSYEYEVFISYAHRDNMPPPDRQYGWVTRFDQFLEFFLREWLGKEPRIWRDNMMRGSDVIEETIFAPLPNVAIMIAIVSPNYPGSLWCAEELAEFCRCAIGGTQIANKSRIFKIVKVPLRQGQQLHDVFVRSKGFEFFQIKDKDSPPFFFHPEFAAEAQQAFRDKVGDVAYEIIEVLDLIDQQASAAQAPEKADSILPSVDPAITIYLASATPDLVSGRDNVRRDLLHRGYQVIEAAETDDVEKLRTGIREDLGRCQFSLHLIGNDYAAPLEGSYDSLVEAENECAAECADSRADFYRLIWIPRDIKPQHHSQRRLITNLLDSSFAPNTELLRGSLEDFKTFLQDRVNDRRNPTRSAQPNRAVPLIGIICDELDAPGVQRLDECLYEQEYDVFVAAMAQGSTQLSPDQLQNLKDCYAIVIYMDNAPLFWVQERLRDMTALEDRRADGFGAIGVYLSGKRTVEKERFRTRRAVVIKNFEDDPAALLDPLPFHLLQPLLSQLPRLEKEGGRAS